MKAPFDHEPEINLLSSALRGWEPSLDLYAAADNSLIYEPDGTLYLFCLSRSTLRFRHHCRAVAPGDAVIVPQGCAIDAVPGLDHVSLRHEGLAPYHFRERFIQVVGFELIPFPPAVAACHFPMISRDDYRYRLPFAACVLDGSPLEFAGEGPSLELLAVISGTGLITEADTDGPLSVKAGDVVLRDGRNGCRLEGSFQGVMMRLVPETVYEVLRSTAELTKGSDWSPEFTPRPS